MPKTFTFEIYSPGEVAAGLRSFSERVTITVGGGFSGEDHANDFEEFMRASLAEWYYEARVWTEAEFKKIHSEG